MRISDWSSDVCSSDLVLRQLHEFGGFDAERLGDAVHPAEREGAGAAFEAADRLRGGRRLAALRDLLQRQAPGASHGADTVDHAIVLITISVSSFLQNHPLSSGRCKGDTHDRTPAGNTIEKASSQ